MESPRRTLTAALSHVGLGDLAPARLARRPLVRFLTVGLLGLATDALVFCVLHDAGLSRAAGRALSLVVATAVTWRLNRRFTFPATGRRQGAELGRYAAVVIGAQGISYAAFLTISWAAPRLPALAALVVGAVAAAAVSFTGQRLFTFRQPQGHAHAA